MHLLELFPFLANVKVLRQWAGLCDMTPDYSPIMGTTPIRGFYLDSGWGTWGFKATPVCGTTMAYTLVKDQDHELIRAFNLSRFKNYSLEWPSWIKNFVMPEARRSATDMYK